MSKRIDQKVRPRRKARWRWLLVLGYMACVFVASAIPGRALPKVGIHDKLLHAVEFAGLAFLLCRAVRVHKPALSPAAIFMLSVCLTVVYGMADEGHQLLVAGRTADIADLLADGVGALAGTCAWIKLGERWPWLQ